MRPELSRGGVPYQIGGLALQRLRIGGEQQVTVQHVNVGRGGRALIGA